MCLHNRHRKILKGYPENSSWWNKHLDFSLYTFPYLNFGHEHDYFYHLKCKRIKEIKWQK